MYFYFFLGMIYSNIFLIAEKECKMRSGVGNCNIINGSQNVCKPQCENLRIVMPNFLVENS